LSIDPRSASKIDPPQGLVPVVHRRTRALRSARPEADAAARGGSCGPTGASRGEPGGDQARFLKRQLSLPVSTMSQRCVRRSSSAVVIFGSPKTLGHSPNARFVVTITVGVVGRSFHGALDRVVETRPTCAAFKFQTRFEQRLAATYTREPARSVLLQQCATARRFCSVRTHHVILSAVKMRRHSASLCVTA
jgi:hypothetical protein